MKHRLKYMNGEYKDYPDHSINTGEVKNKISNLGEIIEFAYKSLKDYWNNSQLNDNEPEWRNRMNWTLLRKMDKLSWNIYSIYTEKKQSIDVVETINYLSAEMSSIAKYSKFINNDKIRNDLFEVIKYISKFINILCEYLSID